MDSNLNRSNDFREAEPQQPSRSSAMADQWKSNLNTGFGKVRDYARSNPSKFLGGLAALAIGAGLMRGRRM